MAHPGGRPTKYNPQIITQTNEYIKSCGREQMTLPTIQGLAIKLCVNKTTIYEWAKENPEFSNAIDKLMDYQAQQLINDGIYGGKEINAPIVKLMLMNNHGMREKSDTDVTSNGKEIQPVLVKFLGDEDAGN